MMKNKVKIRKKTLLEAQGSKKMIWVIVLLGVFFAINLISAFNWADGRIVSYYKFDEGVGTWVNDSTGHGNNGTIINSASWVGGIINGALNFSNQSAQYINFTATNVFNVSGAGNFSISTWIYPNSSSGQFTIASKQDNWILEQNGLKLRALFLDNNDGLYHNTIETTNNVLNTGRWQHIVFTYNGTGDFCGAGGFFAVNGTVMPITITQGHSPCANTTNNPGNFRIGSHPNLAVRNFNGGIDEFGFWNRTISSSEVSELYNSGAGLPYAPILAPTVNLISPTDPSNITTPFTFNASIDATNFNLTNATLYIWYSNSTLYTSSTNSLTGNTINSTTWGIGFSSFQNGYLWNVRACSGDGASGNCSFAFTNLSFNVKKIVEFNQTFSTPITGGSTQTFNIRLNASSGYAVTIPYLVYNGTSYEGTLTQSGTNYIISRTITVPFPNIAQNYSFYWNITLDDSTYFRSSTQNQTINTISLDSCASFTNQIFSFSMSDEETLVNMSNTTIEYAFNIYNQARTTLLFGTNASSNANPTTICLSSPLTNTTVYSMDATLKYHGNDSYVIRYYNFLNYSLTNSSVPRNIILYDVLNATSLPFLLTFRNSQLALGSNILVYVNKQYLASNDFKTVEVPITDSNGQTILNLVRNTAVYNFIMVDINGNVVASFSNIVAFCQDYTIGSCAIDLNAPGGGQLTYNYDTDVGISYSASYLNSSKLVTLAFNSINSSAVNVRMLVRTENQFQNKTVCDTSQTAITSSINCNLSNAVNSNQYFFVDIYVGGRFVETVYINTNPFFTGVGGGFGMDGFFIAILIVLSIILLFADDKQSLVIAVGVGWAVIVALGLVKGGLIGIASGGIWLIVTIFIFLWKLKKEETG